jgi:hypothetical protein
MQNTHHLVVIKFSLIVVGLGSFLLNGERSWAQVPAQKLIPATPSLRATTLTPAQPQALQEAQETAAEATPAASGEATSTAVEQQLSDQRMTRIKAVKIDRRPSAVLEIWASAEADLEASQGTSVGLSNAAESGVTAEGHDGEVAVDPNQASLAELDEQLKSFSRAVTLGDWETVKALLTDGLSDEESTALYLQLLQGLARTPDTVPADLPPDVQQQLRQLKSMQAQQRRGQPEVNQISWDDILILLELAPGEREPAQLAQVGLLCRLATQQGHAVKDWVERLGQATQPSDSGEALLSQREAAILLIGSGQAIEAGGFLPPVTELQQASDLEGLNLLTQHLLARYQKDKNRDLLKQAWMTTQAVLATQLEKAERAEKEKALQQAVELAPQVEEDLGQAWLDASFRGEAQRGKEILASIGSGAAKGLESQATNSAARLKLLELQRTAVDALLTAAPDTAKNWHEVLSILAANWLREANLAYQFDTSTSAGPVMQRDAYGNIYYLNNRVGSTSSVSSGRIAAIATGDLLELKPAEAWMELVDESLRPEFQQATARLYLKVKQESDALPFIEQLAASYPAVAQELVDEFLRVWTQNHDPNSAQNRTSSYLYVYGFQQRAQSIPLTRSKQQRNLEELAALVRRLRELPVELDEDLMQRAFTTCHSQAEVYRLEAIEEVFGDLDSVQPETIAALAQGMRTNLGGLWREPATQETAQTKRKKKDIQAEVQRGYEVARDVIDEALKRYPNEWTLHLADASLAHDENNYRREISPTSEFVDQQQKAFAEFQAAAQLYVDGVEQLTEDEYSVEPFQLWFYASLGACDLRQIDTDKRPDTRQPELIRSMLEKLPKPVAEKHLAMFANDLFTRMSAVSPGVKFSYLEGGFKIVGDHEQARQAKQVYDYYSDLVTEIQLEAVIDGKDVVGSEEPFGVFVNLKHTVEIERESGGFTRYLQNQNTGTTYYYNYGRPLENYRDKFEEFVRSALDEHFEVLSVTFQSEDVNSRATEVDGWRYTPYAYLLLKARGPEVDKLPPVRIDLDFMDTSGYVVLPIESTIVPLVASQEQQELRPVEKIALTQTLDERQADEGKLILEVQATANGLVPPLADLVQTEFKGFKVQAIDDQGLSVSRFDPEANENQVISDRSWLITLEAAENSNQMPQEVTFAAPKVDVDEVVFQRYEDADLVEVPRTIQLERNYGKRSYAWMIWWIGLPAILVAGWGLFLARRSGRQVTTAHPTLQLPTQITPFSVLSLLEEIGRSEGLNPEVRQLLRQEMQRIERAFFSEDVAETPPDLASIAQDWVQRAGHATLG